MTQRPGRGFASYLGAGWERDDASGILRRIEGTATRNANSKIRGGLVTRARDNKRRSGQIFGYEESESYSKEVAISTAVSTTATTGSRMPGGGG